MSSAASATVLDQRRQEIDQALERALPDDATWPTTIHRAMRYSLFAGGKRIRPLLVLAAAEAVGGRTDDVLSLACAVEMIHTYSLIHDDLPAMDNDDLRRGKPTSHKVFGEAIAILAGDALLTRAFELLAEGDTADANALRRRLDVIALMARAGGTTGLIGGQVMDLESEGEALDGVELERMHRAKTGALIAASVVGGGILAGAGETARATLADYGSALGLAFQVVDDVLDATETAEHLGKTAGKDSAAHKVTYVRVHGVAHAQEIAQALLGQALAAAVAFGARGDTLAELARRVVDRRG